MKTRKDIQQQYKWNLSDLVTDDKTWEQQFELLKTFAPQFLKYKGKLNNIEQIYAYLMLEEKFEDLAGKLGLYIMLNRTVDLPNSKYTEMQAKLQIFSTQLAEQTAFISIELHKLSDRKISKIIKDARFKNYVLFFKNISRSRPHLLSEKEEQLMASIDFDDGFSEVFDMIDDVDLKFQDIEDSTGKKHELNQSNYSGYAKSEDRVLRKNAFESLYKGFESFSNTISTNFINDARSNNFYRKVRKYDTLLQKELYNNKIDTIVYNNLIKNVNGNIPLLQKFWKLNKVITNLKDYAIYDTSYNPIHIKDKDIPYQECTKICLNVLSILGKDYTDVVQKAIDNRWIDVYPHVNKRSGGFQVDEYTVHPYIMLNCENKYNDVSTFIHEIGHAMHSYYSNANQPRCLSDYPIFLAEIASTLNEILLIEYKIDNSKTETEKAYYIREYLQMFKSTIFRQTMFSEFENFVYENIENNLPLSKDILNKKYFELNEKYFGSNVKVDKLIQFEWLRIPHFYTPYYVYKYATGLISAICLVEKIKTQKDGLEKYLQMLKSGGNDYPTEILKNAGVDLEKDEPFVIAFDKMKELLNMFEKLTK